MALALDNSYSSTSVHSVLATLRVDDVRILDAIIHRCHTDTNFPAAYKAYSDVLDQLGLDAHNDGTYYMFLLKIGLLKGKTWGDKWQLAKQLYPPDPPSIDASSSQASHVFSPPPAESTPPRRLYAPASDTNLPRQRRSRLQRLSAPVVEGSSGSSTLAQFPARQTRSRGPESRVRDQGPSRSQPPAHDTRIDDVEEALESLRNAKPLASAESFRRRWLLRNCFTVWKGGLIWIQSTHAKVAYTRSYLETRNYLTHWRIQLSRQRILSNQALAFSERKLVQRACKRWFEAAHRKARAKRKQSLSLLYAKAQDIRAQRQILVSWKNWVHYMRCRVAMRQFALRLESRCFHRWTEELRRRQELVQLADQFRTTTIVLIIARALRVWYNQMVLNGKERILCDRRRSRTIPTAFLQWKKAAVMRLQAKRFHATAVRKVFIQIWRKALQRKRAMAARANLYRLRADERLVRAACRIWVARERGELYIRSKSLDRTQRFWIKWRQKHMALSLMNDEANKKVLMSSQLLLQKALQVWVVAVRERADMQGQAIEYFGTRLLECAFLSWRLRLREGAKQLKQAKAANRFFTGRAAWAKWKQALILARLEKKCVSFSRRVEVRHFEAWRRATAERVALRRAALGFRKHRNQILKRRHLQFWTRRVIDIKLRQLETADRRDKMTLMNAFGHWRGLQQRTVEHVSLLESVQLVRSEDLLRRCFMTWLALARSTRHRVARLESYRAEMNQIAVIAAWETWRGRFKEVNLVPAELELQKRMRANLLFKAFLIWQTKSKNLPAIHMRVTRLKKLAWDRWKSVLPSAKRERQAREFAKRIILRNALAQWRIALDAKKSIRSLAKTRYQHLSRGDTKDARPLGEPLAFGPRVQMPPLTTGTGRPVSGLGNTAWRPSGVRPKLGVGAEEKPKSKSVEGKEAALSESRREIWRRLRGS